MPESTQKLKVFLCHASQDKPIVRDLYRRLAAESWIDPWLDEEKLLPGADWDVEIEQAVEVADVVLVCLSSNSVTKEGYVQRELRFVLDVADYKPEGTLFVIPIRLEDCSVPRRLRVWQYLDFFPAERRHWAYHRLLQALVGSYKQRAIVPVSQSTASQRSSLPKPKKQNPRSKLMSLRWVLVGLFFVIFVVGIFFANSFLQGIAMSPISTSPTKSPTIVISSTPTPTTTALFQVTNTSTPAFITTKKVLSHTKTPHTSNENNSTAFPVISLENISRLTPVASWDITTGYDQVLVSPDAQQLVFRNNEWRELSSGYYEFDKTTITWQSIMDGKVMKTYETQKALLSIEFIGTDLFGISHSVNFLYNASHIENFPLMIWLINGDKASKKLDQSYGISLSADVVFSPDKSLIAVGNGSYFRIWKVGEGNIILSGSQYTYGIQNFDFSPDNKLLAFTKVGGTAQILNIVDGAILHTIPDLWQATNWYGIYQNLFFSPKGDVVVLNSSDGLQLIQTSDGTLLSLLTREKIESNCTSYLSRDILFAFSPNETIFAVADIDGAIALWNIKERKLLNVQKGFAFSCDYGYPSYQTLSFSPDGTLIIVVAGHTVKIYAIQ